MEENSSINNIYQQAYKSFLPSASGIIKIITNAVPVDLIFFLGGATYQHNTGTVLFQSCRGKSIVSKYYVLIVSDYSGEYEIHEIESIIEHRCTKDIPVIALIIPPSIFNTGRLNGSCIGALSLSGCCIYNSDKLNMFSLPQRNNDVWKEENEKNFNYGWQLATSFFEGAAFYRFAGRPNMAAFMLHQSAEHALKTILRLCIGDAVMIHNNDRLLQLAAMFSADLQEIFNIEKTEDKRLLQLLDSAYLDARYSNDFAIQEDELSMLTNRIKCIHTALEDVWMQIKE